LWIAALVASGFSVVPVASQTWKSYFGLLRSKSTKVFTPVMWNIQWLYLAGSLAICYVNCMVDEIPSFYLTDN
jgi:hypothetical protein